MTIHVEQERPSNLTVSIHPDRKRISRRLAQGSTQISSRLFWLYWSPALEISPLCQLAAFIECDMYDTSIQLLSAPNGHVPKVRSYPLNMYLKGEGMKEPAPLCLKQTQSTTGRTFAACRVHLRYAAKVLRILALNQMIHYQLPTTRRKSSRRSRRSSMPLVCFVFLASSRVLIRM